MFPDTNAVLVSRLVLGLLHCMLLMISIVLEDLSGEVTIRPGCCNQSAKALALRWESTLPRPMAIANSFYAIFFLFLFPPNWIIDFFIFDASKLVLEGIDPARSSNMDTASRSAGCTDVQRKKKQSFDGVKNKRKNSNCGKKLVRDASKRDDNKKSVDPHDNV